MKNSLFVFLLFWGGSLFAQQLFMEGIGGIDDDQGYGVVQLSDGSFVSGGFTKGLSTGTKPFCNKYDTNGNLLWSKAVATLVQEKAYCIASTSDGGFILGGEGKYCVNFNCGTDAFAMKMDANGDFQWMKGFGGLAWDEVQDIKQTADGGYIMAGSTVSYGVGSYDWLVIRTNGNGDTLWTKTFGLAGVTYAEEKAYSVVQTPDGGFVVGGYFYVGDDLTPYNYWAGLVKTNANGDLLWAKTYHTPNMSIDKGMNVIGLNKNGNLLLATHTSLVEVDPSNGNVVKSKKLPVGFTFVGGQWSNGGVYETMDESGLLLCGGTGGDACLLKCDYDFNVLWSKKYTNDANSNWDFLHKATQIADGRILLSGYTQGKGAGSFDNLLIAAGPDGDIAGACVVNANLPAFTNANLIVDSQTPQSRRGLMTSSPTGTVEDLTAIATKTTFCTQVYTDLTSPEGISFTLYPNPSDAMFVLSLPTSIQVEHIRLTNLLGETVWQAENPTEMEYDLSSLPNGTYFYLITGKQGSWTGKWMKK